MAIILNIETATQVCSVAIAKGGQLLALKESTDRNTHSSDITLFIEEVLNIAGTGMTSLDAIAVSAGPGSYTGLRIGVATAKGLCYALDKPLIAVSTLKSLASGIRHPASEYPVLFCPMLDARRMEVYCAMYDEKLNEILSPRAELIHEHTFADLLEKNMILFAGDGSGKCKAVLANHRNALFLDNFQASAANMIGLAEEKFRNDQFEDPAYFEPFYLKDFVAGKPRVKGLR